MTAGTPESPTGLSAYRDSESRRSGLATHYGTPEEPRIEGK